MDLGLAKKKGCETRYSEEFAFYITTKLPNPHYLPEICIKVAVINFTVTSTGLTDQLVGDVTESARACSYILSKEVQKTF